MSEPRGKSDRSSRRATGAPDDKHLRILRWLYVPWAWLVFIPYLGVSTALFGSLAFLVSFINEFASFHVGTIWAWLLCRANFMWVVVRGRRNHDRRQSYIMMCNHQSHIDVPSIYGNLGANFRWVIKMELRKIPIFGAAVDRMGHIYIDRSDREAAIASLNAVKPKMVNGKSILFFPEGTRSRDGRIQPFKKGGFVMAQDMGLPILPISISGTHRILPGKSFKLLPGIARITIHEPIDTTRYGQEDRDRLMADVRAAISSGLPPYERGEQEEPLP